MYWSASFQAHPWPFIEELNLGKILTVSSVAHPGIPQTPKMDRFAIIVNAQNR